MIFAIATFLASRLGMNFEAARKVASAAVVVAVVLFVLIIGITISKCGNKPAKLNEAEIQQGEAAVKARNDNRLIDVLANADVREQGIDNSIKAAEEARRQAVANYSNMNSNELAAELERRK